MGLPGGDGGGDGQVPAGQGAGQAAGFGELFDPGVVFFVLAAPAGGGRVGGQQGTVQRGAQLPGLGGGGLFPPGPDQPGQLIVGQPGQVRRRVTRGAGRPGAGRGQLVQDAALANPAGPAAPGTRSPDDSSSGGSHAEAVSHRP